MERTAAVGGVSGTATVNLRCTALDHFGVSVNPDIVEHGESAVLTVIAQDANNNEVTIEGNTPLTITVDKPEYGSIVPASGVSYSVARAAGVRYLANGTNPLTPQRIGVTVTGAGKSGSGSVVVKKKGCGIPPCGDPPPLLNAEPFEIKFASPPEGACGPGELAWTAVIKNPGRVLDKQAFDQLFSVDACADQETKTWKFHITKLGFAYGTGLCPQNLAGRTDIGDGDGAAVNEGNYCEILQWLNNISDNTNQPPPSPFYSGNILQIHESFHRERELYNLRFRGFQVFTEGFEKFQVPIVDCSETSDGALARNQQKTRKPFDDLMEAWQTKRKEKEALEEDEVNKATRQYYEVLVSTIEQRAIREGWTVRRPCQ